MALDVADVRVPMRDGTALATDVLTAPGTAVPAMLFRSPYSRAGVRMGADAIGLARRGWGVVVQDVRGRFDSQGSFEPFAQEAEDGVDCVAWCASRPWCDGRVVAVGASYEAGAILRAAGARPPALAAMGLLAAAALPGDRWRDEGGALQLGWMLPWSIMIAASDPRSDDASRARAAGMMEDLDALYRTPLGAHPVRDVFPAFAGWLDQRPTGWAALDDIAGARIPAFHVAGWFDLFCDEGLRTWQALSAAGVPQRIVVGPWTHDRFLMPTTPELSFGPQADGSGLRDEMTGWLRDAIDGRDVVTGARLFVMGSNRWIETSSWPPATEPLTMFLDGHAPANTAGGGGVLRRDAPADPRVDAFVYDPRDPVPTRGGRMLGAFLPFAGPADQRPVEDRPDVLVYTSDVLAEPLTIVGHVRAAVRFCTSGRSADVTVKLVDVHPDGRALAVLDSVRRAPFRPGRTQEVEVDLGATAMCFAPGHRLRVEVSSSNFPRLDRNPSTGVPSGAATTLEPARQQVHTGGPAPSRIVLPVVAG